MIIVIFFFSNFFFLFDFVGTNSRLRKTLLTGRSLRLVIKCRLLLFSFIVLEVLFVFFWLSYVHLLMLDLIIINQQ